MAAQSEKDAVKKVDKHVSPKECFVWYMNNKRGYEPIPGTGCAHWVAHQKGWNNGKESSNGCKEKYLLRVSDVVKKAGSEVDVADVTVGNVWADDKMKHCGIVAKVTPSSDPAKNPKPTITIENCSDAKGGVVMSDWTAFAKYFKNDGKFYKG
jgi:hypothetical protein